MDSKERENQTSELSDTVATPPLQVGKYQVLEKVGESEFNEVYKGFDPDLEKHRAIKMPKKPRHDVDKDLEKIRHQAGFVHGAAIQIYDVIKLEDGRLAIVMEHAGGENLRQRLTNGPVDVDLALAWIEQLADALARAHDHDLLHYDIKPENILFDENDNIKLTDFGLARQIVEEDGVLSQIVGTPAYKGPEQRAGKEDKRSEIWSLGAVFYEMITGSTCPQQVPAGKSVKDVITVAYTPVHDKKSRTAISKPVMAVVSRMLEPDPDKRFQTMDDVVTAIRIARTPQSVLARKRGLVWSTVILIVVGAAFFMGNMYAQKNMLVDIPFLYRFGKVSDVTLPEGIAALPAAQKFDEGLKAFEQEQNPLAYKLFDAVEKEAPQKDLQEKAAYMKASMAIYRFEDKDLAAAEFKSFIDKYHDNSGGYLPYAHYFLGQVYFEKERYKSAAKYLQVLIEKYPDNSNVPAAKSLMAKMAEMARLQENSQWAKITGTLKGFNPNNLISLLLTGLGVITAVAGSMGMILLRYIAPPPDKSDSVTATFKVILKHKGLRKIVMVVMASQILSFCLNLISE